jgi:hypothetical protein
MNLVVSLFTIVISVLSFALSILNNEGVKAHYPAAADALWNDVFVVTCVVIAAFVTFLVSQIPLVQRTVANVVKRVVPGRTRSSAILR